MNSAGLAARLNDEKAVQALMINVGDMVLMRHILKRSCGSDSGAWFRGLSLRARILLLVLVATVLPVLAMLGILLENRSTTVLEARNQLDLRGEIIAGDLDDKIAGTTQLLFGLAHVPIVRGDDKAAYSSFLADVLKEHPQYTGLLTIKLDGTLFCDSLRSGRVLKLTDRAYFQQALTAKGTVVEPVIGRLSGKGVLQIAYPVRDADGGLRFIILASLDLSAYGHAVIQSLPYARMHFQIWNRDASIIMDNAAPGASSLAVTDDQRRFMLGGPSTGSVTLEDGEQARIWTKASLPRSLDTGLQLALSVPESELNERVDRQFKRALFGLVTLAILIFLAAAVLGEFAVRRQAARLMEAISRMDAGEDPLPLGADYPRGELVDPRRPALEGAGPHRSADRSRQSPFAHRAAGSGTEPRTPC